MAIDPRLSAKWEGKLYRWALWSERTGPRISSAYSGKVGNGAQVDVMGQDRESMDTDSLLLTLRGKDARLHRAICEYIREDGTRGAQAARLGIHQDTYRARVNAALVLLELMHRARRNQKPHTPLPRQALRSNP